MAKGIVALYGICPTKTAPLLMDLYFNQYLQAVWGSLHVFDGGVANCDHIGTLCWQGTGTTAHMGMGGLPWRSPTSALLRCLSTATSPASWGRFSALTQSPAAPGRSKQPTFVARSIPPPAFGRFGQQLIYIWPSNNGARRYRRWYNHAGEAPWAGSGDPLNSNATGEARCAGRMLAFMCTSGPVDQARLGNFEHDHIAYVEHAILKTQQHEATQMQELHTAVNQIDAVRAVAGSERLLYP